MWPPRDPEQEHLCFHDDASLVQEVYWPSVPATGLDLSSMKPPPSRLATLQCHSWTQSSTPGWGLVLKASRRQDAAPCGQREHTGQSREAGGAERNELHGTPVPQGSGWCQLDGAPEHASHVHTPLHLTHTQAHTLLYIRFTFPFPTAPGTQASQCPLLETPSPVTPTLAPPCALAAISHVPGTVLTLPQWTHRMTCFPCPGLLVAQGRTMAPRWTRPSRGPA